jgi:hypothetical protein
MFRRFGFSRAGTRTRRAFVPRHRARVQLEELESRNLLSVMTPVEVRTGLGLESIGLIANTRALANFQTGQLIDLVSNHGGTHLTPGNAASTQYLIINIGSWNFGSPWGGTSMTVILFSEPSFSQVSQQSIAGLTQTLPTITNLATNNTPSVTFSLTTAESNLITQVLSPVANLGITNAIASTVTASASVTNSNPANPSNNTSSGNSTSSHTLSFFVLGGSTLGNILTGTTVTATQPTASGQNPALLPGDLVRILQTVSSAGVIPTVNVQSGTALTDNLLRPLVPNVASTLIGVPPAPGYRIDNGGGGMDGVRDAVPQGAPVLPVDPQAPAQPQKPADPADTEALIELFDAYFGNAYIADQVVEPVAEAVPVSDGDASAELSPALLAACAVFCFSGGALAEEVRTRDRRGMRK